MSTDDQTLSRKSRRQAQGNQYTELLSIFTHLLIVAYVTIGWTVASRSFLFVYVLVLPCIMLQWLLNGGSSVLSNFENLARIGRWDDAGNKWQGAFFQTLLHEAAGLMIPNGLINLVVIVAMFAFWVEAMWLMVLIVPMAP